MKLRGTGVRERASNNLRAIPRIQRATYTLRTNGFHSAQISGSQRASFHSIARNFEPHSAQVIICAPSENQRYIRESETRARGRGAFSGARQSTTPGPEPEKDYRARVRRILEDFLPIPAEDVHLRDLDTRGALDREADNLKSKGR